MAWEPLATASGPLEENERANMAKPTAAAIKPNPANAAISTSWRARRLDSLCQTADGSNGSGAGESSCPVGWVPGSPRPVTPPPGTAAGGVLAGGVLMGGAAVGGALVATTGGATTLAVAGGASRGVADAAVAASGSWISTSPPQRGQLDVVPIRLRSVTRRRAAQWGQWTAGGGVAGTGVRRDVKDRRGRLNDSRGRRLGRQWDRFRRNQSRDAAANRVSPPAIRRDQRLVKRLVDPPVIVVAQRPGGQLILQPAESLGSD